MPGVEPFLKKKKNHNLQQIRNGHGYNRSTQEESFINIPTLTGARQFQYILEYIKKKRKREVLDEFLSTVFEARLL